MDMLVQEAHAKINLSLDVLERLSNGYHLLEMVMQTISLSDTIILRKRETGIDLICRSELYSSQQGTIELPSNKDNLVWKAAESFFKAMCVQTSQCNHTGIQIELIKRIPIAAGLAGGSTDAAAVLKGLNTMYGSPFTIKQLCDIGKESGADIPYCIIGGTALAQGIGEVLTPISGFSGVWLVLVNPDFPVSTAWVFQNLCVADIKKHPNTKALIEALDAYKENHNKITKVAEKMVNVLEEVTIPAYPDIEVIRQNLLLLGALAARMSGSGPTVFGLFKDKESAQQAYDQMKPKWQNSFLVQTI